ncbi:MAG: hypothetical protein RSD49_02455 [Hafnia sp.]
MSCFNCDAVSIYHNVTLPLMVVAMMCQMVIIFIYGRVQDKKKALKCSLLVVFVFILLWLFALPSIVNGRILFDTNWYSQSM